MLAHAGRSVQDGRETTLTNRLTVHSMHLEFLHTTSLVGERQDLNDRSIRVLRVPFTNRRPKPPMLRAIRIDELDVVVVKILWANFHRQSFIEVLRREPPTSNFQCLAEEVELKQM